MRVRAPHTAPRGLPWRRPLPLTIAYQVAIDPATGRTPTRLPPAGGTGLPGVAPDRLRLPLPALASVSPPQQLGEGDNGHAQARLSKGPGCPRHRGRAPHRPGPVGSLAATCPWPPPSHWVPAAKAPHGVASTAPSLGRHSATRAAAASPHPSPRNRASLRLPKALPTRTPPSFRRVHPNPESDSAPRPTLGLSLSPRWENTLAPATDTACPRRERHTRPRVLCRSLTSGPLTCPWGQGLRPESGSAGPGPGAPMGTPALHPCYPQHALRTPGKTQTLLLDPPGPQGPWSLGETPQGRTSP